MKGIATLGAALALGAVSAAGAFEIDQYRSLVAETVGSINSGDVDVGRLLDLQEALIQIGLDGLAEYGQSSPPDARLMDFVAANVPAMRKMTLDEIEMAWHQGGKLEEIGLDFHAMNHFGPAISHMDAVLHPVTAALALEQYDATGDGDYLDQVVDELSEVIEHLQAIY